MKRSRYGSLAARLIVLVLVAAALSSLSGCGLARWFRGEGDARSRVVETARSRVGTPYRPGGCSPASGFDCSGFTWWVYAQNGVELPRRAADQFLSGRKVAPSDIRKGDLLFFETTAKTISHVGIYEGKDRFIHCPSTGGHVRRDRLSEKYWERCFVGACSYLP